MTNHGDRRLACGGAANGYYIDAMVASKLDYVAYTWPTGEDVWVAVDSDVLLSDEEVRGTDGNHEHHESPDPRRSTT